MPNRKPNRLRGHDYSRNKLYFVTTCVQDRICCLGRVMNGQMVLNAYGEICERQWYWMIDRYPYVSSHAFVVMPNHIHGVIEIDPHRSDFRVGTGRDLSLHGNPNENGTRGVKIKSLSELMGVFKTTSSKHIHSAGLKSFAWQRSFHDHIIRYTDDSYDRICDYIKTNPQHWPEDCFYEY